MTLNDQREIMHERKGWKVAMLEVTVGIWGWCGRVLVNFKPIQEQTNPSAMFSAQSYIHC